MDFIKLAKEYGTPLYVYDFNHIKDQFLALKEAFRGKKSLICYAIKANSNLSIIHFLSKLEAGADCVSINEVKRALLAGVPKYKIIFSGVGKSDNEIKEALELDILFLNVESEAELVRIEMIAKELNKKARISLRVNPNINPKTHPYISTGLHENKFGIEIELAKKLYLYAHKSNYLEPVGIHFHIGSQLTKLSPIKEAAEIVADLARGLIAANVDLKFFDVGGGIGIKYDKEKTIDLKEYANTITKALKKLDLTIICEPGRFIVGNSGYFLTSVLYEKQNGKKRFVVVDGAMNDLIRPSLYGAYHKIEAINKAGKKSRCDVVGPVCESGDFLAKDITLPKLTHGDILVVYSAGAYCMSMASNYNSRLKPAEVAIFGENRWVIRKREEFSDLIKNESIIEVGE